MPVNAAPSSTFPQRASIRERTTFLPALNVRFCLRKVADQYVYKHVRLTCDAAKVQFKKISLDGEVLKYYKNTYSLKELGLFRGIHLLLYSDLNK